MGEVVVEGGVAPYAVDWGGYNPGTARDLRHPRRTPTCAKPSSVLVSTRSFYGPHHHPCAPTCSAGPSPPPSRRRRAHLLDWGGVDPDAAPAGEHTLVATDNAGCTASANVVVLEADIPDPLVLNGNDAVGKATARRITTNSRWEAITLDLHRRPSPTGLQPSPLPPVGQLGRNKCA